MNTFYENSFVDKNKWINAFSILLLSFGLTYFIYYTKQNINMINEYNNSVKPFNIEKGPEIKEVSVYGMDLKLNNDFGVNYILNKYNVLVTEKKIIDLADADYLYINKNELVTEYKTIKENNFKFLACFSARYDHSCLFFKQKYGYTTPEEEYVLYFLLGNKSNLPSPKGFIERLQEANNMELLNELNIEINKENILTVDKYLSNNSRFMFDKKDLKEFSYVSHGFHLVFILLIICFIRLLYIYWHEQDAPFAFLAILLFSALAYGFNPFF